MKEIKFQRELVPQRVSSARVTQIRVLLGQQQKMEKELRDNTGNEGRTRETFQRSGASDVVN